MNTLTVNLHLLMATFYRPTRRALSASSSRTRPSPRTRTPSRRRCATTATTRRAPSCGCGRATGEAALRTEDIVAELERLRGSVALVLLGGVNYLTGELLDIPEVTAAGHDIGAVVGWDLAHAVGNVPLDLQRLGRRLGGVVPLQVRQRRARRRRPARSCTSATRATPRCRAWRAGGATTPRRASAWSRASCRARGAVGWQVSTPSVLAFAPLRASLELFDAVGMPALRERSLRLTGYLESLLDVVVAERRAQILTPREPARRGCQLSLVGARRARALGAAARRARRHLRRARARRDPARPDAALLELPRLLARRPALRELLPAR